MSKQEERANLVASAMRHKWITLMLVGVLMLSGMFSLISIPKNEFPHFDLPVGLVVGVYPGASELEVEEQLAKPLEEFLWTFNDVNKLNTRTVCQNGLCVALVMLRPGTNTSEFWGKLQDRLPLLKMQLPAGVLGLVANDDFGEASAMLITIESREKTFREMNEYVEALAGRLRAIPELANIIRMGGQKEQISVYVDRDRLSMYGMNTLMLYNRLSGQAGTTITGSLDDGSLSRAIHIQTSLNTENDVAQTIVYSDAVSGTVVRLGDIATIKREYPPMSRYIKNNGNKCILLSLQMVKGNNIISFGDEVKKVLAEYEATLPTDVQMNIISDQSQVVSDSVKDFLGELLIAIISVIIVVMLMLPLRVAGVAVVTIPITIFSSIAFFYLFGVEINTVTLAALVVSLGMIVDDSVVVVDCYLDKLDEGVPRWKAAIDASREFVTSIITATLAISITFFPLIFTTDALIHDFLQWFPYAISIVLTVSLFVAIFVVPILQFYFIRKGLAGDRASKGKSFLDRIQGYYDRGIECCFSHKRSIVAAGVGCVLLGGLLMKFVPQRLMPRAERDQFAVEIYLPTGTDITHTAKVAEELERQLRKDQRVTNITIFYGSGSPRFHTTYAPQFGGSNFAQFIVNTKSDRDTQGVLDDYAAKYANYFPEAQILFRQIEYSDGQYPVEVRLFGENLDSLHRATDSVMTRLLRNKDLMIVRNTWGSINNRLEVLMRPEEANRIGLSKSLLSLNFALRYGGGIPVTEIWENGQPLKVIIKDAQDGQQTIEDFKNIRVTGLLPTLTASPLSQVADVKPEWADGAINHRNGLRMVSVLGMPSRHAKMGNLTREVYDDLNTLRMPEGVKIVKGGQAEMESKYGPQIFLGLYISIVIIFFILVFHLKSIKLTLLLMFSLSYSLLGGALGILLSGHEFGVSAVLGLISLMGIIVRCGIIMIDYAEQLRTQEGLPVQQAALLAAKRRFRPIFLTSAAASMGVIPMVVKNSPLWGPMGITISVGAMVSMVFIVTVIPVGYYLIMRNTIPGLPRYEDSAV